MAFDIKINGNQYTWASIKARIDGEVITGFTAIDYSDALERELLYGAGGMPFGRPKGKYVPDKVKLTTFKGQGAKLRKALAAKSANGKTFSGVSFPIVVQFIETVTQDGGQSTEVTTTDELVDCQIDGVSAKNAEGTDASVEEFTLSIMGIKRDGLTLFDSRNAGI